jgi:hypothetical protein
MPLFRREPEQTASRGPVMTINGRPQPTPEAPGAIDRRNRLFVECERRLADDPITQQAARGSLVGDGTGLERLTARIAPLFEREQSLIRWVALRGAFAPMYLYMFAPLDAQGPNQVTKSPEELADVMGLTWVDEAGHPWDRSSAGKPKLRARDEDPRIPPVMRDGAVALATVVTTTASDYGRIAEMSAQQAPAVPKFSWLTDVIALDCIAWCAVALLRFDLGQIFFSKIPEPDALPVPGWYHDPLFGKCERYWDGSDWTSSCRRQDGRRLAEFQSPLR